MTRNAGSRKRAARWRVAATLAVLLPAHAVAAGGDVACTADGAGAARVATVADDFTLRLADGRAILLVGIEPPGPTALHPDLAVAARGKLDDWLGGHDVLVRLLAAAPDRWNRWPALVFAAPTAGEPPSLSVAFAAVDAGLARARPGPEARGCWAALLGAEGAARDAGLGLWADPYYAVREAADGSGLSAVAGDMALVQGRVTRVGDAGGGLVIGLEDSRAGVSLRLGKRDRAALARRGWDAERLRGARVRVRGLADDRFGPGLDGVDADGIEVLGGPGDAGEGTR